MQLNHEHTESYAEGSTGGGGTPDPHTHTESDIVDLGTYISDAPSDGTTYGRKNGAWASVASGGSGGGLFDALVVLKDVKSGGTSGGSGVADTWTARVLNTKEADTASICTLASNQFSLPAGTYYISGQSPYYKTRSYKTRLYNVTDSSSELVGSVGISDNDYDTLAHSFISGVFTITATKTFEYQYRADQNDLGNSALLGNAFASNSLDDNVFSNLTILRLS